MVIVHVYAAIAIRLGGNNVINLILYNCTVVALSLGSTYNIMYVMCNIEMLETAQAWEYTVQHMKLVELCSTNQKIKHEILQYNSPAFHKIIFIIIHCSYITYRW